MKKTTMGLAAMILVLMMGASFASAADGPLFNGITVFSAADQTAPGAASNEEESFNGITAFKSASNDTFEIETTGRAAAVESSAAGSSRSGGNPQNGATDFRGTANDRFEIGA